MRQQLRDRPYTATVAERTTATFSSLYHEINRVKFTSGERIAVDELPIEPDGLHGAQPG
jgi:hypothetical protein